MMPAQTIRRWGLVAALGLLSIGSWEAANRGSTDQTRTEPVVYPETMQTPILSARRAPRSVQAPVADAALIPSLEAAIANSPSNTCLLVQAGDRVLKPSANAATPLVPASNQKLLTTFVALELLGPEFRFRTTVRVDAQPASGVVAGNLYLIGSGDPFLSTDSWWTQYDDPAERYHTRLEDLADRIKQAGVTQITGAVVGDESLFDPVREGPWADRLKAGHQSGPLSALTVNEGFATWPAKFPGNATLRKPADDPAAQAAATLAQLLVERGITVAGPPAAAPANPAAPELAAIESPPLSQIVTHINSYSSNLGAELLLKRLGVLGAADGSTAAGATVVQSQLTERGIPTVGLDVVDGSGLSDNDRVSCLTLAAILNRAGPDSPLAASLAIGGKRGSLQARFDQTPADERLLAKTGTLNDVLALSGFVRSANDPDVVLTFAYVTNEAAIVNSAANRELQDAMVLALTTYPGNPSLGDLGPEPAAPR
jgi:serine-type D-Ala-D-Ala carboxypeptidase/endopeptidase (penicillin-binding protein 4)